MPRFTSVRNGARDGASRHAPVRPVLGAAAEPSCESYTPGHQMHYLHQGQALHSPSDAARNVIVDGDRVVVILSTGEQVDYRHHEPRRLTRILSAFPTSRVLYREFHALRVGPYWFNCAPSTFTPCGTEPADPDEPATEVRPA